MQSNAERTNIAELVILVDEDGWNVRTVRHVLTELGFRVMDFSSTAAAMPIVATRRAGLVLTEHAFGGVDGLALSAQAHAAWGDARPALIAMTSSPTDAPEDVVRAYDAILRKPIRVNELMDAVDLALASREPYRESARTRRQARA